MPAWLYILRLQSGRLVVGSTADLGGRLADHMAGKGGKTTHDDPPVALAFEGEYPAVTVARRREAQVKRWSRARKEALVSGETERLRHLSVARDHQS